MSVIEDMVCENCNQSAYALMLLAMLQDAGAKVYPSAKWCSENKGHNFKAKSEAKV